jgi:hypothetical protein
LDTQTNSTSTTSKNILIAIPGVQFAEGIKTHIQAVGFKVIEIVVVLEHLIETIEQQAEAGVEIHGILISSDIARKQEDKRLEVLGDHLLAIRGRYSDINIVFLSNEAEGHPLLAELVGMGIYNIFVKSSKSAPIENISSLINAFIKIKSFSDVQKLRDVNTSIPWRRLPSGPSGINVNINKEAPQQVIVEKEKIVEKEVVRVVERLVEVERVREVSVPAKMIMIGSLYPGAGSTFITLGIARLLNYIGISTAVVEHPVIMPTLHTMLFGEKNAPNNYSFIADQLIKEGRIGKRSEEWVDGSTGWYPSAPSGLPEGTFWSTDMTLKLLYNIKEPVILVDVSHNWNDVSIRETCLDADEIIFVADSMLSTKYTRPDTVEISKLMFELKQFGKNVHIVANRDVPLGGKRKQWLQSLPYPPEGIVPDISYKNVVTAAWDAKLIFDEDEVRVDLLSGLYSILRRIVPTDYPIKNLKKIMKKSNSGFLSFLKR